MLHSYAFSNFRSFLERVEVSLTLTDKDSVNGWDVRSPISDQRLTTALAVLGANASGKTSLLKPLAFLWWFVRQSFASPPDAGLPVERHFNGGDAPTTFEVVVDAYEPDTLWRYTLSVNAKQVLSESIERKVRRGVWKPLFERALVGEKYHVTQDGFGLDPQQAEKVRPNVSLIAWAAQFEVRAALEMQNFMFLTNMNAGGRVSHLAEETLEGWNHYFANNAQASERMQSLLRGWDLGLAEVRFTQHEILDSTGATRKKWFAFGVHRDRNNREHVLRLQDESSGTRSAFALLALVVHVLDRGGVMAYDELDSDLHPHLLEPLLELFSNPDTNPHRAQILFTCHMTEVLRFLQKSQVMLVEKDGLTSHAWRLDTVEGVRSDENRVAKYLAGAYGAVPRL
jgi:uncharacterized protein